ncbi:MAG: small multi-drug export protein [Candidatus Brennerbacteria bacterium]|nr:small multi-drug export protein [Candidatus Brennerbacteria bacterium]
MKEEILTLLIAMSPFFELRGAIPVGIFGFAFTPPKAYILGVLGSFIPVLPLLFFWKFLYERLIHRLYFLNRFFAWLFERTRAKHQDHFELWKDLALLVFVAVPLPLTGAWSGTVAAFVFGVPIKQAAVMIGLGNMISGFIVLLLSGTVSLAL